MEGALSAIGAVVTAVITCLALWFAAALFFPDGHVAIMPALMAVAAFLVLQKKKMGVVPLILLCGMMNLMIRALTPTF
jgi:hypothetical protein